MPPDFGSIKKRSSSKGGTFEVGDSSEMATTKASLPVKSALWKLSLHINSESLKECRTGEARPKKAHASAEL